MDRPRRVPLRLNHEPDAVRWAREKAGLTQTALAERAGLGRTLVVEIEAGTRNATPVNLTKIAEALNCPVVALERKREPQTTPPADGPVPMRDLERPAGAADMPDMQQRPLDREAS